MTINVYYDRFVIFFRLSCWLATLMVICYWIYRFGLNEDVCIIDYKKYYDVDSDMFPVLSLCIKSPFSKTKFRMRNQVINETLYIKFLKGEYFSTRYMETEYNDIRLNLSDYIDEYYIQWRNGSSMTHVYANESIELFIPTFAGFWNSEFYNCYDLQTPHNNQIIQFAVLIRNSVFPLGFRSTNYDLFVLLHYPNQLLISYKTLRHGFSKQGKESSYAMRFQVRGVEILQRRNKNSRLCNENWQNYDHDIFQDHINRVGCRAPYQGNKNNTLSLCSSKGQMSKSMMNFRSDGYGAQPPCRSMEKIDYTYSEDDFSDSKYAKKGSFWISLYILNPQFKEIVQAR